MIVTTVGEKAIKLKKLARSIAGIDGVVAECGVYQGGSLEIIARALPLKEIVGFDTFSGLPQENWSDGELHGIGDFRDSSIELVRANLVMHPHVKLIAGIFPESAVEYEGRKFAFAYIDFDFYLSTKAAIEWFLPRMTSGGIMVFDDYDWKYCPGVKRAIDDVGLAVEPTADHQVMHRVQ